MTSLSSPVYTLDLGPDNQKKFTHADLCRAVRYCLDDAIDEGKSQLVSTDCKIDQFIQKHCLPFSSPCSNGPIIKVALTQIVTQPTQALSDSQIQLVVRMKGFYPIMRAIERHKP